MALTFATLTDEYIDKLRECYNAKPFSFVREQVARAIVGINYQNYDNQVARDVRDNLIEVLELLGNYFFAFFQFQYELQNTELLRLRIKDMLIELYPDVIERVLEIEKQEADAAEI